MQKTAPVEHIIEWEGEGVRANGTVGGPSKLILFDSKQNRYANTSQKYLMI